MLRIVATAASKVTETDLESARLGPRFKRLDCISRLALLAVESMAVDFKDMARERIAICLSVRAGSLSTDLEYWKGRALAGGPSPTLFIYTLPSSAIGEIAIRYRLTGPNLCFVGDGEDVLAEASDLIRRGEADACVCVCCNMMTPEAARMTKTQPRATACAVFLEPWDNEIQSRGGGGERGRGGSEDSVDPVCLHQSPPYVLQEFDSDMESLCGKICVRESAA